MIGNWKKIDTMGGSLQMNRSYKKDDRTIKAAIRLAGSSKYPVIVNRDTLEKIWALKDDPEFMGEIYPELE
jgi:hypothetical protein